MEQCIFHIDMDAFYVSVECLLDPSLKGKALVVGVDHPRGVVAAASYEARKYGVFSAMSCVKAKKLCPHLLFANSGREHYSAYSKQVMECIKKYSHLVEVVGIDEAYLDASGFHYIHKSPYEMAQKLQKDIFETTKLTASIGIAPLRFLAKIASDMNKPHGIYEIKKEDINTFIKNLDLYKIPHVGKKFLEKLHKYGIYTGKDAQQYSKNFYETSFGKQGIMLYERVHGIDNTELKAFREAKSESAENTLDIDTLDVDLLKQYLKKQAERVSHGLRKKNKKARVVTLKIKFSDFTQISRQISLEHSLSSSQSLYEVACHLLEKERVNFKLPIRLIGLGASHFDEKRKTEILSLFDDKLFIAKEEEKQNEEDKNFLKTPQIEEKRAKIDRLIDAVRAKHGDSSLKRS